MSVINPRPPVAEPPDPPRRKDRTHWLYIAVIVGPSPEMAEYVEGFGVGAVTRDFTSSALAELVDSLDAPAIDRMKASANAHARELSSESQVLRWKRAIDGLAPRLHDPASALWVD